MSPTFALYLILNQHAHRALDIKQLFYLLKKRGLSAHDIIKYNIGYCEDGEYTKKIIIPSYDLNGKLN